MPDSEFMTIVEQSAHQILVWVGFGTLVGLVAKAIMPGRDPGGAVGTLMMGIAGCVIGCGVLMFFRRDVHISPISPLGFLAGVVGAFLLLFFYRILSGSFFAESEAGDSWAHRLRRRRRRQAIAREL